MSTLKRFWTESGWKKEEIRMSDFLDHLDGHLGAINSRLDTLSEYIGAHGHRLSTLESRLAALEELKADFSAEKKIRENLERRIIDLEAEKQPKEEVPRVLCDKNFKELIPRRSVVVWNNSEHTLFLKNAGGGFPYCVISLVSLHESRYNKGCVFAYNMHPHIAEAIIDAAEKKEDC